VCACWCDDGEGVRKLKLLKNQLRGFVSLLCFFTIIPVKRFYTLEETSLFSHLLPLLGLLTGGVFALSLFVTRGVFGDLISSVLGVLCLGVLTGAHEVDGFMDFCDGLMCPGDASAKLSAMKDSALGVGGVFGGVVLLLIQVGALSLLSQSLLVKAALSFEILGKLSMVFLARFSRPLSGSSSFPFSNALKGRQGALKLLFASSLSVVLLFFLIGAERALILFFACIIFTYFLSVTSNKLFGGANGDVFGASNELVGTIALLLILVS
jgi:adenosylcobinamide-GDP ribazoletransferase